MFLKTSIKMSNGVITSGEQVPVKKIPTEDRLTRLRKYFEEDFQAEVDFFVRVPGRVNLIGEHIDYCGYPVLPMALEQDILVAVGLTDASELALRNVNESYVNFECRLTTHAEIEIRKDAAGRPQWYDYVLCGVKGAMEQVKDKFTRGIRMYIDGNIPPASGLSSSSALVSSACLSFLHAQGIAMEKSTIASLCARSERYIGTEGGGMDQAIAFLAKRGDAQYIAWNPLRATPVTLPEDAVFVVAHSLAEANKAATNDFNRRVVECRLAAKVLAKSNDIAVLKKVITLSEVQKALCMDLQDMLGLVQKCLPLNVYSREDICNSLGITDEVFNSDHLTENTKHLTEFKLQQRATHVYEEAMRVEMFRKICSDHVDGKDDDYDKKGSKTNGNAKDEIKNVKVIEELGRLIRSSHYSLENLYECSHPNLNRLVSISDGMGIACRLTGAGWGGCVVALCPRSKVRQYIETLKRDFYSQYSQMKDVDRFVFATKPNDGAVIFEKCYGIDV